MARLVNGTSMQEEDYTIPGFDFDGYWKRQDETLKKLQAESDKMLEAGKLEGVVFTFQVADGYAYYRVVSEKPLTVEHLPYGDGYAVHVAMIRGLRVQDIHQIASQAYSWRKLFTKR